MGETATLVSAGDDVTVDPNELPYELDGAYIRIGQGVAEVSQEGNEDNEFYVVWEQQSGPVNDPQDPNNLEFQAIFSDPGDPESDVTFVAPGVYTLRLVSFERLCGSDNESRTEMEITVLPASDCAGYLALGGARDSGDVIGNDCSVGFLDFAELAMDWMETWP